MGDRTRHDLKPLPFSGGTSSEIEPNEYDSVRKVIPWKDSKSLPIGARTLSTEMSCPICLDLLSQTMTAKECLHRFCSECITMALQRGNKECPTCRKKLVSKRSLRPDPSFDLLISKVWPDRSIYDNLQQHELEMAREAGSDGDDEDEEVSPEGGPAIKKKKIGFDNEAFMEYFLAQQSRRQKMEEEEFPELNGEQAYLEREAIDNLLDNGTGNHYDDDYNEDDDVYGDELELDESGNVIERNPGSSREPEPESASEDPEPYDPYAYSEENEEGDYDEYEPIDAMAALTPEQQEELQNELEELEAIEFEPYDFDFSDEEVPEEGDENDDPENNNGIRCTSDDEPDSDDEDADNNIDADIEDSDDEEEDVVEGEETVSEETEDSSSDSKESEEEEEEEKLEKQGVSVDEIDGDATPPAYAPEMDISMESESSVYTTPQKASETDTDVAPEPTLVVTPITNPLTNQVKFPEKTSEKTPEKFTNGMVSPFAMTIEKPKEIPMLTTEAGGMPAVQFTPPREDEDENGGEPYPSFSLPPTSVIAIAPSLTGVIVKEERMSPPPTTETIVSSDISISIEEEGGSSDDSTTTTYSSSGCTSSISSDSSTVSMVYDDLDDFDDLNNDFTANVPLTEGDIPFNMSTTPNSASTSCKPAATSLAAFSEEFPHHKDDVEGPTILRPPSSTIPPTDRLNHWLANSPSSPQSIDEDMTDMPTRRADDGEESDATPGCEEIEAELLPAASMLNRDCPVELLIPRYIRARSDTKMEHLAEFIHQRAIEEALSNTRDYDSDPVPSIAKPTHFYVFSRNVGHHVKKIFLHETMATALSAMTQGDHLIIFFDIEGIDLRGEKVSLLGDVVPSHFLSLPTV